MVDDHEVGLEEARSRGKGLQLENFCASLMVVEGGDLGKEKASFDRPRLALWVATSRI